MKSSTTNSIEAQSRGFCSVKQNKTRKGSKILEKKGSPFKIKTRKWKGEWDVLKLTALKIQKFKFLACYIFMIF